MTHPQEDSRPSAYTIRYYLEKSLEASFEKGVKAYQPCLLVCLSESSTAKVR